MESYSTENEQKEALRNFFAKQGKYLAIAVVVAAVAIGGLKLWESYSEGNLDTAAKQYRVLDQQMKTNTAGDFSDIDTFIAKNKNSYGVLASLQAAQYWSEKSEYERAESYLVKGAKLAKDDSLKAIAITRLARVQMQQDKFDAALAQLESVKAPAWLAMVAEVRGDVLLAKGDRAAAKAAYQAGLAGNVAPAQAELLRLKLNDLAD